MTREAELLIDMWDVLHRECHKVVTEENYDVIKKVIKALEQEPQTFKWCTDCREYDQEKHCCHRWSKVIRDTVEEMKQEPILNKINYEISHLPFRPYEGRDTLDRKEVLEILNKYKAENEEDFTDECKRLDGDCDKCTHKYHCISSEYNGRH